MIDEVVTKEKRFESTVSVSGSAEYLIATKIENIDDGVSIAEGVSFFPQTGVISPQLVREVSYQLYFGSREEGSESVLIVCNHPGTAYLRLGIPFEFEPDVSRENYHRYLGPKINVLHVIEQYRL